MKNIKLSTFWESLRSSYWFVPTLMAGGAIALAFTIVTLDQSGKSGPIQKLGWVYTGGPDGARTVLSTIAGSMITVAGTAFSIVIVALTLASSQFGPRLLRNFMQDTGNQVVLGTFIATFIYCLLVLRTVRGDDYNVFVPQISVTVGILLGIASIGVLIYFIHHASTSIQSWYVIREVNKDLDYAIDHLFPEQIGHGIPEKRRWVEEIPVNFDEEASPILAINSGYLLAIDEEQLLKIAKSKDLLLRLNYRPGHFIVHRHEIVRVWHGERVNEKLTHQINDAFILGSERTEQQDVEFSIQQLVEIALRAISPAINDPFTAIRCIDRLSAGLNRLAQKEFPSPYRYDEDNNLRVIANPVTFVGLIDEAFNQIRQYGSSDVAVTMRLLEAIAIIATQTRNKKDRTALLRHAEMIKRGSQEAVSEECDRQDIEERYLAAVKVLRR
ncbi:MULTISPECIES: DUF2254 domain-containing protein [unclassified Coleofasciculus]|uniref:DUF2254 domain-containing protein n=1 Tax=unclassified Coleofasciculus TaxID=2692782 RepID=UPI001881ABCE|nr:MULTISPECIES: DUF2254 domain-containing protein [unclassified Coleofasciculus]MBE9130208.1 DUF2254 domain-containing protein [Coleofasciculus sp. LEGE 07081]MBE9149348.1 DUF2254 domain-containing protein [Coleofasciculus sp. LEGE 07092]